MKKRLLILTEECRPQIGGVASYLDAYLQGLPQAEYIIYSKPLSKQLQSESHFSVGTIYRYPQKSLLWPSWKTLVWRTLSLVRKYNIDRIHVHHILPHGYAAYMAKLLFDTPYVVFVHGTDIFFATRSKWKRFIARHIFSNAETVVSGSIFLKNVIEQKIGKISPPIEVLYPIPAQFNPISNEESERLRSHMGIQGKKICLSSARFVKGKGFDTLLRAFRILADKKHHVVLLLLGDGPERESLASAVHQLGLQQYVRFVGNVPHGELGPYLAMADIYVQLPEKIDGREEGFGLSFAEASTAALPSVGTRIGGIPEIIEDGITGFLVPEKNPDAAAEALEILLNDEELRKAYGSAAKSHAEIFSLYYQQNILNRL